MQVGTQSAGGIIPLLDSVMACICPQALDALQFVTKRLLVDISSLTILELVSSCSPAPYGFSYPYAQMSLDNSRLALLELLLPIGWTVNHGLAVNAEYHSYVSN